MRRSGSIPAPRSASSKLHAFAHREGVGFARGAEHREAVTSPVEQPARVGHVAPGVDAEVGAERRDRGRPHAVGGKGFEPGARNGVDCAIRQVQDGSPRRGSVPAAARASEQKPGVPARAMAGSRLPARSRARRGSSTFAAVSGLRCGDEGRSPNPGSRRPRLPPRRVAGGAGTRRAARTQCSRAPGAGPPRHRHVHGASRRRRGTPAPAPRFPESRAQSRSIPPGASTSQIRRMRPGLSRCGVVDDEPEAMGTDVVEERVRTLSVTGDAEVGAERVVESARSVPVGGHDDEPASQIHSGVDPQRHLLARFAQVQQGAARLGGGERPYPLPERGIERPAAGMPSARGPKAGQALRLVQEDPACSAVSSSSAK